MRVILNSSMKIFSLMFYMMLVSPASEANMGKNTCLDLKEGEIVKTRVMKDNLLLATRKCKFSKKDLTHIDLFEKFFHSQDIRLVSIYKRIYGKNYKKTLNNFITENSNQASVKYSYNNIEFCTSYKNLISKPNLLELNNRLNKFKLPTSSYCR